MILYLCYIQNIIFRRRFHHVFALILLVKIIQAILVTSITLDFRSIDFHSYWNYAKINISGIQKDAALCHIVMWGQVSHPGNLCIYKICILHTAYWMITRNSSEIVCFSKCHLFLGLVKSLCVCVCVCRFSFKIKLGVSIRQIALCEPECHCLSPFVSAWPWLDLQQQKLLKI